MIPAYPTNKTPPAASTAVVASTTLKDLADKWEAERKPDWKSVAAAHRAIRRFTEMVGDILPRDIARTHIVAFKDKMLESGQTGVNTNKQLTVLSVLLNYGVANGEVEHNPAHGIGGHAGRNTQQHLPQAPVAILSQPSNCKPCRWCANRV